MSHVQRFSCDYTGKAPTLMIADPDGDWVSASAYDALSRQLDDERARAGRLALDLERENADRMQFAAERNRLRGEVLEWKATFGDQLKVRTATLRERLAEVVAALELACPPDPFDHGDLPCQFCGVDPGAEHKNHCAWITARAVLAKARRP
jgi:hypothetical protein